MIPDEPTEDSREELALKTAGRALIMRLCEEFPRFAVAWEKYLAGWGGESCGPYMDIAEFAHFVDNELFTGGEHEEIRRAFLVLDHLFLNGDEPTRDLIGIGFVEDLQNILSGSTDGHSTVIPLLPPTLLKVWGRIEKQWAGHSSLMEVLEAEVAQTRNADGQLLASHPTWAQLFDLPKT